MIITPIETQLSESAEWQQQYQQLQGATTLAELVWIALQMGLWMARLLLESVINGRGQAPQDWPDCPKCGHRLRSHGYRSRQITTCVGDIH
jgi:hypothetical protein